MAYDDKQCSCGKWINKSDKKYIQSADGDIYCSVECFDDDTQFLQVKPFYKVIER